MMTLHDRFKILDVNISVLNIDKACSIIDEMIRMKEKSYVCVAPVSTIVTCQENSVYKELINKADLVTPDGVPVVWLGRLKGFREIRRTYGPDLMTAVCKQGQSKGYRHYLYGGTSLSLEKLEKSLKQRFPDIHIVGRFSPPFRELTLEENEKIIQEINRLEPDIIWVGLGAPKQDFWMSQNRAILSASVLVGVGAAFDFLSGMKRQAPRWMQRIGLEWFFRLCCEPRRLGRRYLIGNSKFIYYLIKDAMRACLVFKR